MYNLHKYAVRGVRKIMQETVYEECTDLREVSLELIELTCYYHIFSKVSKMIFSIFTTASNIKINYKIKIFLK